MFGLCFILFLAMVTLIVLLWMGAYFFQGYIYTEPSQGLFWQAPVGALVLTFGFTIWTFAIALGETNSPTNRPIDTLLRFDLRVETLDRPAPSRPTGTCRWRSCFPSVFPDLTFVRIVRANKLRQAVSLWKAVQTATWREDQASAKRPRSRTTARPPTALHRGPPPATALPLPGDRPPPRSDPGRGGRAGTPSSSTAGSGRSSSSTRTSPPTTRPAPSGYWSVDLSPPEDFDFEPRMKRQSDRSTTTGSAATASCGSAPTSTWSRSSVDDPA